MALYLGNDKIKLNFSGHSYCLNLFSETLILNGVRLFSFDNYALVDSKGLIITVKESE